MDFGRCSGLGEVLVTSTSALPAPVEKTSLDSVIPCRGEGDPEAPRGGKDDCPSSGTLGKENSVPWSRELFDLRGLAEARAIMEFSFPISFLLRVDFLRMEDFFPVDLRVVPIRISLRRLSMMQPSSSGGGGGVVPLASAALLFFSSAAFFAASRFSRFSSKTARCLFSCKSHISHMSFTFSEKGMMHSTFWAFSISLKKLNMSMRSSSSLNFLLS